MRTSSNSSISIEFEPRKGYRWKDINDAVARSAARKAEAAAATTTVDERGGRGRSPANTTETLEENEKDLEALKKRQRRLERKRKELEKKKQSTPTFQQLQTPND